jgi:hypothetical protein
MEQELRPGVKVERIIALKRFERPPPGYFHLLPGRIISRIEKGESPSGFWENWGAAFGIRPALACAFGLSVCGAVVVGICFSPKSEATAGVTGQIPASVWAVSADGGAAPGESESSRGLHVANWLGSTNPVTAPEAASMFETADEHATPVSFFQDK